MTGLWMTAIKTRTSHTVAKPNTEDSNPARPRQRKGEAVFS